MLSNRLATTLLVVLVVHFVAIESRAAAQESRRDTIRREAGQFDALCTAGKFQEAETYILGLIDKYRRAGDGQLQYYLMSNQAELYLRQDRTPEALPVAEKAVIGCAQHWGPRHMITGSAMRRLGRVYSDLNRLAEASTLYTRAREIAVAEYGPDNENVRSIDSLIASDLAHMGRYQEAEAIRLRVLASERRQSQGRPSEEIAIELHNLANLYYKQARHKEAEPLLLEASEICVQVGLANSVQRAKALDLLADVYQAQLKYPEAERSYLQAYDLYAKVLGADHPLASIKDELADVYASMGQFEKAEPLLRQSLKAANDYYGEQSSRVFDIKTVFVMSYLRQGKYALADEICAEQQKFAEQPHIPHSVLRGVLTKRAVAARGLEDLAAACRYDAQAVELEEEDRTGISGGEQQRATSMSASYYIYSLAAIDHLRNNKFAEGFAFSERGRARTLLDQMALGNVDLFAGMSPQRAQQLRSAYEQLQNQTTALEQQARAVAEQTNLSAEERQKELAGLGAELQAARKQQTEAYSFIRNESPAFRRVSGQQFAGVSLADLQAYLKREQALMLYYLVAPEESLVLAIDEEEQVHGGVLKLDDESRKVLGVDLNVDFGREVLQGILTNEHQTGVAQLLSNPASDFAPKLRALSKLLISETILNEIRTGRYRRLIIVPDGPLALLPFEALVVEQEPELKFLLDVAPPISYSPSATILMNLAQRPVVEIPADRDPVLALGDPAYNAASPAQSDQVAQIDTAFRSRGGKLSRLPYSGLEATWVARTFSQHGMKAGVLRDTAATEAAVRTHASNRRIVHLACHGLADDELDNFFGALALAPGNGARPNSRDDGFLTLSELYELDLRACELAILSACQTNYGPRHEGEGVWALSRSFLVAGSRRVVASNWLVDDKAGASLISYFCGALVKQPQQETDYASALREAKRWTRDQTEWRHPYYWATFELIGPR